MQISAVADTVIGLSFVFFLLSVASSAIAEGLATVLEKRSKYLLRSLRTMLGEAGAEAGQAPDSSLTARLRDGVAAPWRAVRAERTLHEEAVADLNRTRVKDARTQSDAADQRAAGRATPVAGSALTRFLGHPLVAAQAQRRPGGEVTRAPSYLAASTFALVVLDELIGGAAAEAITKRIVAASLPAPLETALTALARQAEDDVTRFTTALENWYDTQMARVSGFYKRWVKRWILLIAAVVVLVVHVDAVSFAGTLWRDPGIRQAAVAVASPTACDAQRQASGATTETYLRCLNDEAAALHGAGLEVGVPDGCGLSEVTACLLPHRAAPYRPGDVVAVIAGLALSVLAASFGAPFWFQVLTRAASLRNTGDKPEPGA